ncbi:TVP38/TMEM64 family protein [Bacillus tianshenii]|uniref:TVP38/TMEM64 family protein n=1 Tax=Sutcliffiella tianshenii TaxID=1463404 RepID=UPI001CD664BB|nr:TVP38/TMEM64 family protein [Bacillus tianshenii]MCA1320940.1 TVP38/TMEM64 family protein [Bacillus tianshenii]
MSKKNVGKIIGIVIIIGVLLYINKEYLNLSPHDIREWILSYGVFAPILYIILYTFRPLILFPASVLSLTAGLAFGALWGTVYTIIGATAGAIVSFVVARKVGKGFVKGKTSGPRMTKITDQLEKRGFLYVLLLRLIPLLNFDLISYAAGVSRVKLAPFVLGTLLGIIPGTFAYNFLGSSILGDNIGKVIAAVLVFLLITIIPVIASPKLREKLGLTKAGGKTDA